MKFCAASVGVKTADISLMRPAWDVRRSRFLADFGESKSMRTGWLDLCIGGARWHVSFVRAWREGQPQHGSISTEAARKRDLLHALFQLRRNRHLRRDVCTYWRTAAWDGVAVRPAGATDWRAAAALPEHRHGYDATPGHN